MSVADLITGHLCSFTDKEMFRFWARPVAVLWTKSRMRVCVEWLLDCNELLLECDTGVGGGGLAQLQEHHTTSVPALRGY